MRFEEIRGGSTPIDTQQGERRSRGLLGLGEIKLTGENQTALDTACASAGGQPVWRARKRAEAWDLLALGQLAPQRLRVRQIDADEALRAVIELATPVPVRLPGMGGVALASGALVGLIYPQEALLRPIPGYRFVQIMAPRYVFHAQVAADPVQPLCLGATLPAGVRVREIVLMVYGALSMQAVMLDELDPAGVLNADAARWWQQNTHRIPLSEEPFLGPPGEGR
jgi:hypothetical protein